MKPKGKKKWLLLLLLLLIAAGAVGGYVFLGADSGETVPVFPFENMGMTEYWGDRQESYGPVSADNIQTVFLTETQTVTEVLVKAGDTVKKGDKLMTFDTTLSDLALERKRLAVEKVKLQIQDKENELIDVGNMVPRQEPSDDPEDAEKLGAELTYDYQISKKMAYDGSAPDKALICWMKDVSGIDQALLNVLWQKAVEYQQVNREEPGSAASQIPQTPPATVPEETVPETTPETTVPSTIPEETAPETTAPSTEPVETAPETTAPSTEPVETTPGTQPEGSVPETQPEEAGPATEYHVIFKVTEGNRALASRTVWQGLHVFRQEDGSFSFRFFDAWGVADHTIAATETEPEANAPGGSYTAQELAQMRAAIREEIKDLELSLKMAEAEYKIMQREVSDGSVYAEVDGQVVSVLEPEEALATYQPVIKVSGGGGFYVEGTISELTKEELIIGQEVTIDDWNSGQSYTGEVVSVGDFPSTDSGWNGMGNPNASYYPFRVFVDGSADLQAGRYVNVTWSASSTETGIYLENPFIRTEKGTSYVYVLGENDRLEKRSVVAGKSLWGSYTQILSGITAEDRIAFPYGKAVKDGAPAREEDISVLYEGY